MPFIFLSDLSPIEPSATIRTKTDDKVVKNKIKCKREIKCKIADKATLKRKTVDTLASPLKKVKIAEELEHFANDNIRKLTKASIGVLTVLFSDLVNV